MAFNQGFSHYDGNYTNSNSLALNQFTYVTTALTVGSSEIKLRQDGTSVSNPLYGNTVSALGNHTLYFGGRADESLNFTGKVSEVIIFNSSLSTTDIQTVESGIVSKYGF